MERERKIITAILLLFLLLWLGFFFHRAPRFAGSALGGLLGVSAAIIMLIPLVYSICKRLDRLKKSVTMRIPLARILSWHIYASLIGSALAIVHSGHQFNSWLGILMTAFMLLSVLSGYICRYFFLYVSHEQKEHEETLMKSREAYLIATNRALPIQTEVPTLAQIVEVIADSQYAVDVYGSLKRKLHLWLTVHIWMSVFFYILLILHIVAGVQFGLRWFS